MSQAQAQTIQPESVPLDRYGKKVIVFGLSFTLLNLGLLLFAAGTWRWPHAWAYIGLLFTLQLTAMSVLARRNPELLNERGKFVKKDTKPFDKVFLALYFPLGMAVYVVAGIDAGRVGWSHVPLGLTLAAFAVALIGFLFAFWAMLSNTHFEATVRIQEDRNHKVCTSGPYQYVRHPGYLGSIVLLAVLPLMFGSWLAYIPSLLAAAVMITRTALEDRTLHAELDGYVDYAANVRYRLVPRLW